MGTMLPLRGVCVMTLSVRRRCAGAVHCGPSAVIACAAVSRSACLRQASTRGGQFTSPKDAIPEQIAVALMAMNAEFLQRSALFIRLLQRMAADPQKFADAAREFVERAEALREEEAFDPGAITNVLLEEMRAAYA